MKTHNQIYHVVLRDGKNRIADWSQDFESQPTLGDRITLPESVDSIDTGYLRQATVSRVEIDAAAGARTIEAHVESSIPAARRTVLTLNGSLIPERAREIVEAQLRKRIELPIFEWEESFGSDPIIRLHQFRSHGEVTLHTLQTEVRKTLDEHLQSAGLVTG